MDHSLKGVKRRERRYRFLLPVTFINRLTMKENQNSGRVFTYTQPYDESHVAHDLSMKAMLLIELMCNQAEANKSYGELIQAKETLAQFGFANAKDTKLLGEMSAQMADYKKATEALAFMERVWEKFGTDAMVVRYDHFFEILEKYDMVCGSFDRYLGGVPQVALDTLARLNGMWKRKELTKKYTLGLTYATSYTLTDEVRGLDILRKRLRMPLRTNNKNVCTEISNLVEVDFGVDEHDNRNTLTDVLFIAAPAADMQPLEMRVEFNTKELKELRKAQPATIPEDEWWVLRERRQGIITNGEFQRRYGLIEQAIAKRNKEMEAIRQAVKDEENRLKEIVASSDINRYAKISFVHKEPEIVRILNDPFICSLTPYGVLIHAKWGAEAEDATIKRYEQLRDAIIGKGGEA